MDFKINISNLINWEKMDKLLNNKLQKIIHNSFNMEYVYDSESEDEDEESEDIDISESDSEELDETDDESDDE